MQDGADFYRAVYAEEARQGLKAKYLGDSMAIVGRFFMSRNLRIDVSMISEARVNQSESIALFVSALLFPTVIVVFGVVTAFSGEDFLHLFGISIPFILYGLYYASYYWKNRYRLYLTVQREISTESGVRIPSKIEVARSGSRDIFQYAISEISKTQRNFASKNDVGAENIEGISQKIDRKKLPIAIGALWLLVSIPFSIPIYEEFFRGTDIMNKIFCWLIVASAAWVPFGWKWLTNDQTYPKPFLLLGVLCGSALVVLFLDNWHLKGYFYIPLSGTVTFLAIAMSHDGMRILKMQR